MKEKKIQKPKNLGTHQGNVKSVIKGAYIYEYMVLSGCLGT